jgi:hypothetical protein
MHTVASISQTELLLLVKLLGTIYPLRVKLQMFFSRRAIPDQVWDETLLRLKLYFVITVQQV